MIAPNIVRSEQGYWVVEQVSSVSYPEEASSVCFAVEDGSFWFRHRNRVIIDAARRLSPDGPFLDVGGGNGFVARGLQAAGFTTVLLEPSPRGAANAVERGVSSVICSTLEDVGFASGVFGGAGLFDVLEHIEDDRGFLVGLRAALAPHGRVYLTVPAYQALWSTEDTYAGHFRRYTIGSLRRVVESAGFEVEYATYFFALLPIPVLLFRTLPSRLGRRNDMSGQSASQEHTAGGGVASRLADAVLSTEARLLARGGTLPFGGSVLMVARKR